MSAFLILVKLRLVDLTRNPLAGFFILVMPLVLLFVVGGMFANGHPFERHRVALVAGNPAAPHATSEALARLPGLRVARPTNERAARGSLDSRMTNAVLVVADAPPRLLVRPDDALFGRGLAAALSDTMGPVALEIAPAPRWGYLHYLFPGLLALTVVLTGLYGMGHTMVRYRATNFLKKLATTPLRRSTFIASQLVARSVLVLLQTLLLALAAHLAFALPLTPAALLWLLALTGLGLLASMGAGFALACLVKAEGNMQDAINAVTGPLVLLSEIFFSTDELPGPLPAISAVLPSTQLVRLMRAVLLQGETHAAALLPGLLALAAWLLATFALSLAVFRWND